MCYAHKKYCDCGNLWHDVVVVVDNNHNRSSVLLRIVCLRWNDCEFAFVYVLLWADIRVCASSLVCVCDHFKVCTHHMYKGKRVRDIKFCRLLIVRTAKRPLLFRWIHALWALWYHSRINVTGLLGSWAAYGDHFVCEFVTQRVLIVINSFFCLPVCVLFDALPQKNTHASYKCISCRCCRTLLLNEKQNHRFRFTKPSPKCTRASACMRSNMCKQINKPAAPCTHLSCVILCIHMLYM